ncbi:Manganese transporter SMF1 [Wickerhamiella sorbophila]|uniref:Manganese transporter SMF1 n=1 Tax=Wickerhamiella sorbophila TaxID=45607 RepID=A0A2T0FBY6_9ASCO|nr:Manganese transporter SMF1 [Wickerhamiella sorbophila]PRT52522.1 Manganese transporter SMF1 [Wickerhamiella sorbophila]
MGGSSNGEVNESDITVHVSPVSHVEQPDNTLRRRDIIWRKIKKYAGFIGPGMMVSVAYMDPGNYSTDTSAGAAKQFRLLFVILLSTIIAMYLQTLAIKIGCVTGKDLAVNCRNHLPKWVGICLYIFAEIAIIATDIAEVIGTAIALNILLHIPLIAGVILTIVDVMLVLLAYRPGKGIKAVRIFEIMVTILIFAVVICFCVLLGKIPPANVGQVFLGYLPSHYVIDNGGVYMSAGILGATVMPHSLYLGSAMAVPRAKDYDLKHGYEGEVDEKELGYNYQPSQAAIRYSYRYSVIEMGVTLCSFAVFVNSAILIVAGATMYGKEDADGADLYTLYDMLKLYLSKGAAVTFMVALLCSGQSAGVICTIAGQIVSEGHLNWRVKPWIRRIITRLIAMTPCIVVVAAVGKRGLSDALNWSQVVLTITLPFLAAPLVYLTSNKSVMKVDTVSYDMELTDSESATDGDASKSRKYYNNHWITTILGAAICIFILITTIYLLVQVGLTGQAG